MPSITRQHICPFTCMNGIVTEAVYPKLSQDYDNFAIRVFYFDGVPFDLDGDLEMVVVSIIDRGNCEIMIMEHDGTVWPGWPRLLPGLSESSPVLGDLDGDGVVAFVDFLILSNNFGNTLE